MSIHEERSFAPRARPMKTEPVDEHRPTLRGLAKGHNELHACLEEARDDIRVIKKALGLGEGGTKVAGLATYWGAFRRTVLATASSFVAIAVLYRIAVAIAPAVVSIMSTINQMVLSAHI